MKTVRQNGGAAVYLAAFFLPAGILLFVYAMLGIYPFGGKTLLTIDMTNEYVAYFAAFKAMVAGSGSPFYSFGMLLGGNTTGLFAYYLASPFNLIFCFFSLRNFDIAILLITLLKTGCCGLAFAVYLTGTGGRRDPLAAVFPVFYALMAYTVAYQLNIMWLDGVICLPLAALGLERLIARRRPMLYILSLAAAILTNFYIGFMICLFAVPYFFYRLWLSEAYATAFEKARFLRARFGLFAASSLLSGGISAALVVPAVLSLRTGKETFRVSSLAFSFDFSFFRAFSKLVLGAFTYPDVISGLPLIFCGLLAVLLTGLFFVNRLIPMREKLLTAAFLFLLLLCFWINTLNRIWHGFNPPQWFPYRYSFVFSFLILTLAWRSAQKSDGVRIRHVLFICLLMFASCVLTARAHLPDLSEKNVAVTAAFTAIYGGILIVGRRGKSVSRRLLALMLIPYVICEFGFNTGEILGSLTYADRGYYTDYVARTQAAVQSVTGTDDGFYRLEKTFARLNYDETGNPTFNDSLLFGYNGLSHYSSTDDKRVNTLMGRLGFMDNYNWAAFGRGATPAAASLLGVKYILSQGAPAEGCVPVEQVSGITVGRNDSALPVGYLVPHALRNVKTNTNNPFALQNSLLCAMLGDAEAGCFSAARSAAAETGNIRIVRNGSVTRYIRVDPRAPAVITYHITSPGSGPLYAFFGTEKKKTVQATLNGRPLGKWMDTYDNGILPLGSAAPEDGLTLTLTLSGDEADIGEALFYQMDPEQYALDFEKLARGGMTVTRWNSTRISGTVTAPEGGKMLFLTIPYDTGWHVTLDGRPARKSMVLGALTGVGVPPGEHRVELRYRPPGLAAGCAVSALSVFAGLPGLWVLLRRRGNRRPKVFHGD